jgi:hypothetical protein
MMNPIIKEMATLLRSTEAMADQFAEQVQRRVGQPISHAEILAAMKKISVRQLSMRKVVAKVKQQWK